VALHDDPHDDPDRLAEPSRRARLVRQEKTVNVAPALVGVGDKSVDEGAELSFTVTATDADLPANTLSYSLDAASITAGMSIGASSGVFS